MIEPFVVNQLSLSTQNRKHNTWSVFNIVKTRQNDVYIARWGYLWLGVMPSQFLEESWEASHRLCQSNTFTELFVSQRPVQRRRLKGIVICAPVNHRQVEISNHFEHVLWIIHAESPSSGLIDPDGTSWLKDRSIIWLVYEKISILKQEVKYSEIFIHGSLFHIITPKTNRYLTMVFKQHSIVNMSKWTTFADLFWTANTSYLAERKETWLRKGTWHR